MTAWRKIFMKCIQTNNIARITVFALLVFFKLSVFASVPKIITFQGVLTDADGKAVTGTKSMVFKIYTSAAGGAAISTTAHNVNIDSNGIYNVEIDVSTLDFNTQYWLGVNVAGDGEMTPRYKISSSGYAINASNAQKLGNQAPSYYLDYNNFFNISPSGPANLGIFEGGTEISSPTAKIIFSSTTFKITNPTPQVASVEITTVPYAINAGTASYAENTGSVDFSELSGVATDDQIPDNITIDTATYAINAGTASYANSVNDANFIKSNSINTFTEQNTFNKMVTISSTTVTKTIQLTLDIDPASAPPATGILGINQNDDWALYISTSTNAGGWQKVGLQN